MGKATDYLYQHESKQVRRREDDARGGKTAYGVAAEKVADIAGVSLSDDDTEESRLMASWLLVSLRRLPSSS